MFFKTTISEISNTSALFNFRRNHATEYVFNVRYLSNILAYNSGSSFVLINDYDRRGKDIYFACDKPLVDVIAEFDELEPNEYYTLNYFKQDNPAKEILIKDIPTDYIIAFFKYWNPSYTWLIYDSYNEIKRVLVNATLDDIYNAITLPTTTDVTTSLAPTTTVAVTTVAPTTVAPTTSPAPTTTPQPTTEIPTTTLLPTTTPVVPTTAAPTTTAGPTTTFAGATFYVSNTGSDEADGTTPGTAWQTVAKVNAQTFDPATQILFKCGDRWRETLIVPSSGTSGQYLYFGNYGTGDNPKIVGSDTASGWTNTEGNIWRTNNTFDTIKDVYPGSSDIYFEHSDNTKNRGIYKANTGLLTAEYHWTQSSGYVYVYSISSPVSAYTYVEMPQRWACVYTEDQEYLRFDGIDFNYASFAGIDCTTHHDVIDYHGAIIENCEISCIGGITPSQYGYGTNLVYSDMIIRDCLFYYVGRRSISMNMQTEDGNTFVVSNVLIENNIFKWGSHTTSLDLTCNNTSGGSTGAGSYDGIIFRNNLIEEVQGTSVAYTANSLWLQAYSGSGYMTNIYIYNNIFKYWRDNGVCMECPTMRNVYIYNNTFYENNSADGYLGYSYAIYADQDNSNFRAYIKNNVLYTTYDSESGGSGALLVDYGISDSHYIADYNLYYRINNGLRIMMLNGDSYYMNTAFPTPEGYETNGIKDNPDFVSASDLHLQASSPAIGAGVHTGVVAYDFDGNPRNNPPCIGAYEYDPAATTIAPTTTPAGTTTAAGTTTPAGTTTYHTTTFTSTTTSDLESYSDDFSAYSTGNLAGQGNWLTCLNQIAVVAGARVQANSSGNDNCVKLNLPFSDDHYAQITNVQMAAGGGTMGVAARCSGSGATATYYVFEYTNTDGYFGKVVNGSYTTLAESTRNGLANDVLKIAVEGTSIKLYLNGSLDTTFGSGQNGCTGNKGSYTDSSISTGVPGIAGWSNLATLGDDFKASDIA